MGLIEFQKKKKKDRLESSPLVDHNGTLFGEHIFTKIIKWF